MVARQNLSRNRYYTCFSNLGYHKACNRLVLSSSKQGTLKDNWREKSEGIFFKHQQINFYAFHAIRNYSLSWSLASFLQSLKTLQNEGLTLLSLGFFCSVCLWMGWVLFVFSYRTPNKLLAFWPAIANPLQPPCNVMWKQPALTQQLWHESLSLWLIGKWYACSKKQLILLFEETLASNREIIIIL